MRLRAAASALVVLALACGEPAEPLRPDVEGEPVAALYTPAWAFEPWISKDISNGPDMEEFIAGFQQRDIPVGVAVLDSPWETSYNTFIPNEQRYPNFADMVARWRAQDIRTVLWVTQMVNDASFDIEQGGDTYDGPASNFIEGLDNGYYVNGGQTYFWWKGTGAAVDFFNRDARDWWHAQQDALLQMGIAGWKLDFGEQYISDDVIETADGNKTLQQYSERYYEDFLAYGQREVGRDELVTMVRPYDESYGFAPRFYARPEHAPVGWVGDQHRDWRGLVDALDHILRSADAGYAVLGSDIGGYLDNDNGADIEFDLEVFQRWTAMSGMMPLFQLHGRANLAPWTVPADSPAQVDETVDAYRYWATLHHAMVPYWFSLARTAQREGRAMLTTVARDDDWAYLVGDAFFVAPLYEPGASRDVTLPAGAWFDWWRPARAAIAGAADAFTATNAREIPLYVRAGAIVPLRLDRAGLIDGAPAFDDALTILVWPDASEAHAFAFFDDRAAGVQREPRGTIDVSATAARVSVALDGIRAVVLRVHVDAPATSVSADDVELSEADSLDELVDASGFVNDPARACVWIRDDAARLTRVITVE